MSMNIHDVERRVEKIRRFAGDPEVAHSEEDYLYTDILREVVDANCGPLSKMAALALTTKEIDFHRYYV